jgi:ribosomal protein S18 acetylase RimI-like enzyme
LVASRTVSVPEAFHRFWIALDALAADVRPTQWGAVVADAGAPDVWDLNYARLDADRAISLDEIEDALLPALRANGVAVEHVLSFRHRAHRAALDALTARGHRLGWDALLAATRYAEPVRDVGVEELGAGNELPTVVADVLREGFAVQPDAAVEQLVRLNRDVLRPSGKRWFGVRDDGRVVSAGTLLLIDGVAYIDDVATLPRWRGRGFASTVVHRIVAEARAAGAGEVYLLADPDAPTVIAMYERLGFREVGRLASTRGPTPGA